MSRLVSELNGRPSLYIHHSDAVQRSVSELESKISVPRKGINVSATIPLIHRDARSAWAHLVKCGGLELNDRDDDFEGKLKDCLEPAAASLDEALGRTTLEKFLRAFFETACDYRRMFEAILKFFETSGATRGREDWCLALNDGLNIGLDHFRRQVAKWRLIKGSVPVPALDFDGAWQIRKILIAKGLAGADDPSIYSQDPEWPKWLVDWMRVYEGGEFTPLPRDALEADLPREFHAVIPFLVAVAHRLSESGLSRQELQKEWAARNRRSDRGDALNIWTLAWIESDFYLRFRLRELYVARHFKPDEFQAIQRELKLLMERFDTRYMDMDVSMTNLEELLRLPIWQQRNDLFAVWIATEIVSGLQDHCIKLHHDNGRLEFGFRETRLATVLSSTPLITLYAEKRSALAPNSGSKTRTQGVQPDYGLWKAGQTDVAACTLAVECKHYKRSAGRKFTEVLSDYALSLPNAEVYLVNYGPIGDVLEPLPSALRDRCVALSNYTPSNIMASESLTDAVRRAVGPPTIAVPVLQGSAKDEAAILLDISPSMGDFLSASGTKSRLLELAKQLGATTIITVDEQIRDILETTAEGIELAVSRRGEGTSLFIPTSTIASLYERAIVVTDSEGLSTLAGLQTTALKSWVQGLCVVAVTPGRSGG